MFTASAFHQRLYDGPIAVAGTQTIRAVAYADGYSPSDICEGHCEISGTVAAPELSVPEGIYLSTFDAELTCATPGTTSIYTTDGSDPEPGQSGSTIYSGPITLTDTTILKAVAYLSGDFSSAGDISTGYYTLTDLSFGHETGTFDTDQSLILDSTDPDVSIYYTTDGSEPTAGSSPEYSAPIAVDRTMTVAALLSRPGWGDSQTVSHTYTMEVAGPVADIAGGEYNEEQVVTLTTATPQTTIYYSFGAGTDPVSDGAEYSEPLTIDQNQVLRYRAAREGWTSSDVQTAEYVLKPYAPTMSPDPDDYVEGSLTVTLSSTTPDVVFISTFDDEGTPSDSNGRFGGTVDIVQDRTIHAVATKPGWGNSEVTTGVYDLATSEISPAECSYVSPSSPLLDWPGTVTGTLYEVQLNDANDFTGAVLEEDATLTTSDYTVGTPLTNEQVYYWQYRSFDGTSWGAWNGPYSFVGGYDIGDTGPAGGIIFYDDEADGSDDYPWRYLEAAPASTEWTSKEWGGYGTTVGGTSTAIGSGAANTAAIVARYGTAEPYSGLTDYAAKLCAELTYGGYDDWFLPSKDELDLMNDNLHLAGYGGFASDYFYWSSSQLGSSYAWRQYFGSGYQGSSRKYYNGSVRAMRAF